METACQSGDPNNINKVIGEILMLLKTGKSKTDDIDVVTVLDAIKLIAKTPSGLRHLRNYAKKKI